jgi:hypothetical protein
MRNIKKNRYLSVCKLFEFNEMFFELTNIQPSLKAGRNYLNNIITGSEIFEKYPNDLKKVFV